MLQVGLDGLVDDGLQLEHVGVVELRVVAEFLFYFIHYDFCLLLQQLLCYILLALLLQVLNSGDDPLILAHLTLRYSFIVFLNGGLNFV